MKASERGAVAVEFAILLPVLLLLLLGVVEFGRALNTQITLTQAAREGARVMAITDEPDAARTAAVNAAVSLPALASGNISLQTFDPQSPAVTVANDDCLPEHAVRVVVQYEFDSITGFIGPIGMTGTGVMQCGG